MGVDGEFEQDISHEHNCKLTRWLSPLIAANKVITCDFAKVIMWFFLFLPWFNCMVICYQEQL